MGATACTKYYEKILKLSDWFFVTHITDEYSEGDAHIQRLKTIQVPFYSDRDITVKPIGGYMSNNYVKLINSVARTKSKGYSTI